MRFILGLLLGGALLAQAPKLEPNATVKQIMQLMTIPASNALFNAGLDEPPKDSDWAELKVQAAVLIDSGNELLAPGRVVDKGDWTKAAKMMVTAGKAAQKAIAAKNLDAMQGEVSDQLLMSCSSCHEKYMKK